MFRLRQSFQVFSLLQTRRSGLLRLSSATRGFVDVDSVNATGGFVDSVAEFNAELEATFGAPLCRGSNGEEGDEYLVAPRGSETITVARAGSQVMARSSASSSSDGSTSMLLPLPLPLPSCGEIHVHVHLPSGATPTVVIHVHVGGGA